jgi:hypothetical protein
METDTTKGNNANANHELVASLARSKQRGPTPYWKTTEERGGEMSPRLTRSPERKAKPSDDNHPQEQLGTWVSCSFSLIEENARESSRR